MQVFCFGDGRPPQPNSFWIHCGTDVDLWLGKSEYQGFLNFDMHKTCVDFPETMNVQNVMKLFESGFCIVQIIS